MTTDPVPVAQSSFPAPTKPVSIADLVNDGQDLVQAPVQPNVTISPAQPVAQPGTQPEPAIPAEPLKLYEQYLHYSAIQIVKDNGLAVEDLGPLPDHLATVKYLEAHHIDLLEPIIVPYDGYEDGILSGLKRYAGTAWRSLFDDDAKKEAQRFARSQATRLLKKRVEKAGGYIGGGDEESGDDYGDSGDEPEPEPTPRPRRRSGKSKTPSSRRPGGPNGAALDTDSPVEFFTDEGDQPAPAPEVKPTPPVQPSQPEPTPPVQPTQPEPTPPVQPTQPAVLSTSGQVDPPIISKPVIGTAPSVEDHDILGMGHRLAGRLSLCSYVLMGTNPCEIVRISQEKDVITATGIDIFTGQTYKGTWDRKMMVPILNILETKYTLNGIKSNTLTLKAENGLLTAVDCSDDELKAAMVDALVDHKTVYVSIINTMGKIKVNRFDVE
ncbi:hypothetical protein EC957_006070 [Mortierella hygrophila]|uniref:Uncharacterized protein n=1 Tax=Mortierella hygrophila TaxID=979708 RepID=A0A9P6JZ58_9FUNG|nr:hypothetical protein EC957_006070 [Mortierella hygrophila]